MNKIWLLLFLAFSFIQTGHTQPIDNSRGVDSRVDYQSLANIGAWDDRNYLLTQEDLTLLSDTEAQQFTPIPAFYRVMLRRNYPDLPRFGPAQYPLSAFNYFLLRYSGFLIDDRIYSGLRRAGDRFEVILQDGLTFTQMIENDLRIPDSNVLVNPNGSAAESAVSVNPVNPDLVLAGVNGSGQDMYFSSDGGNTWAQASDLLGGECCDPTIEWSSDGTLAYTATLGGGEIWFYRSDNNGETWDGLESLTPGDPRRELDPPGGGFNDKEFLHVDIHPDSPFQDNIYVSWHAGNVLQVGTSSDLGDTFSIFSFNGEPMGIGSDLTTDRNGVIYHVYPSFTTDTIRFNSSTDGGTTFNATTVIANTNASFNYFIPSQANRGSAIIASIDVDNSGGPFDGRIYVAWSDLTADSGGSPATNHAQVTVAYSDDQGATWNLTTPHAVDDVDSVDRWQPWLDLAADGTVNIIFYDTQAFPGRDGVDVYHATSTDGAVTFSDPVRITDVSSPAPNDGFQYGDYSSLDISRLSGDGVAIFTDTRDEGAGNSIDVYVAPTLGEEEEEIFFLTGFEAVID